jgi:NADPH2:quinone reductase
MARTHVIRIHRTGGPDQLRYEEVELGSPGPGEALVRHTAIGLNFTDIHFRTGRYPLPRLPHVIGMEAAGVVEAVGTGVTDVSVGDRVCYASEKPRAYAQAVVMPTTRLIRVPDWMDDETAAASILKGLTAQYLIRGAWPVQSGETILIQAAAGGVGLIMCQWAHHLGATVIGTVSTDEKATLARQNGCAHTIVYTREDIVARVQEITAGKGLPVVFDGVGSTIEASLKCLRRRGTCVSYGTAGGLIPPFDLFRLNRMGSLYFTSAGLADYIAGRAEMLQRAADLFGVMRSGAVRVPVTARYALKDAAQAQRDLEARKTVGSVVLVP